MIQYSNMIDFGNKIIYHFLNNFLMSKNQMAIHCCLLLFSYQKLDSSDLYRLKNSIRDTRYKNNTTYQKHI